MKSLDTNNTSPHDRPNDEKREPSARNMLGRFALAYGLALAVVGVFASGFHPLALFWFPMGLAAVVPGLHERALAVGYTLYALLAFFGILLRSRILYFAFVVVLVLNIGGCLAISHEFKGSAWGTP